MKMMDESGVSLEVLWAEVGAAEHWLFVDEYWWAWCAHCPWHYYFGVGTLAELSDAEQSFEDHLVWVDQYDSAMGVGDDDPWELWSLWDESGMAEDVHSGDRDLSADPEFWPVFEHATDWKVSAVVRVKVDLFRFGKLFSHAHLEFCPAGLVSVSGAAWMTWGEEEEEGL